MSKTTYIYTTAANGIEVRIPTKNYPQWKAAQDKQKAQKEQRTAEQLLSRMEKK